MFWVDGKTGEEQNRRMKLRLWITGLVFSCSMLSFAADSAEKLKAKVAQQDGEAAYELACKYYFGDDEVQKNYNLALPLFENSIKWGKEPTLPNYFIGKIESYSNDGHIPTQEPPPAFQVASNTNSYPGSAVASGDNNDQYKKDQEAIQVVADQFNKACIAFTNSVNEIKKDPIKAGLSSAISDAVDKYGDNLRKIDISACPVDFRIAFVKYYQAVHEFKKYTDSITGFRGILNGLVNSVGALVNLQDNTDKAADPLEKAGNELMLICTKYGIKIVN
jgi:hypothetical protein